MHRVDLVTDVPFGTGARGDATRIRALVEYLAPRCKFRVVMLVPPGRIVPQVVRDVVRVGALSLECVYVTDRPREQALVRLRGAFAEDPPAVALVEYVRMTWVLDALPADTRRILDTHDINHERNERFVAAGLPAPNTLDEAQEYAQFARYERVVVIQKEDFDNVSRRLGGDRVLLAPHPARLLDSEVRTDARAIGFVGSEYRPNVEGLRWFLQNVWPRVRRADAVLHVHGNVGRSVDRGALPGNVRCDGVVADLDAAYRALDIVINPVHFGAGLKIKTIEALGAGLPLVTTPEGARGLDDIAGDAFIVAPDAVEFAAHLNELLDSYGRRLALSQAAKRVASDRFSPEACFGALLRTIGETR